MGLVQCLYPLKEYFAEKEGNRMKKSRSEQFLFPLSFSQPAQMKQSCCREGPGPVLLIQLPAGFTGDAIGKLFSYLKFQWFFRGISKFSLSSWKCFYWGTDKCQLGLTPFKSLSAGFQSLCLSRMFVPALLHLEKHRSRKNAEEQGFNKSQIFQSYTATNKLIYTGGISIKMCWWRI